jgi:hypothetical protein
VLRYDVNEAEALRDAAERVLRGETTYSIAGEWKHGDIRPPIEPAAANSQAPIAAQASIGDLDRTECHWGWLPWL